MNRRGQASSTERKLHSNYGSHAIVIGGSLAGLLAARVLADHFDRVTILERDSLMAAEPAPRKGVPQARHLHVLLARGREILQQLFPGLVEELIASGALLADMAADLAWLTHKGWGVRCDSGIRMVSCTRDLLEYSVRCRLEEISQVNFYDDCDVVGLTADDTGTVIKGVTVCPRSAFESIEDAGDSIHLRADLVVDASGRGSRAPEWLEQLGYRAPGETVVNAFLGYTSRVYRRHPALKDWHGVYVQPAPPDQTRGGALFPVEGDRWILTLAGYGRDYAPTDETGFMEFVRSLRTPMIHDAIKNAEPLTPIFTYRATENRLRHYERMSRRPEGFIAIGDAVCSFNPVYAQGMTMAALGALTLEKCLGDQRRRARDRDMKGFALRFQSRLAKACADPWKLATSEDFRVPQCEGEPPGLIGSLLQRYFDNVVLLSTRNSHARKLLLEVFNMLRSPASLFHPVIATKVLIQPFRQLFQSETGASRIEELNEGVW